MTFLGNSSQVFQYSTGFQCANSSFSVLFLSVTPSFADTVFVVLRPDSIDLLFLRSFPDPFARVERENNKIKRKKRQTFA